MKPSPVRAWLCAGALVLAGADAVQAQTSVTLYGALDVGADITRKAQGNVQGTVFGMNGATPVPNALASPASRSARLSPSLTQQSRLGLKGTEDLGGGYGAGFTLEGGIYLDNGTLANDGRLFGRQAFVSLLSPVGEFRLGRQASPMLIGFNFGTTDALGTTDLLGAGLVVNTLQMFQDNSVSYLVRQGPVLAALAYSPNAGVASRISAARSVATASTPAQTGTTGQILGGATAGAETPDRRGETWGGMVAYRTDALTVFGAYHRNDFGGSGFGLATAAGGFVPLYVAERFRSAAIGVKYTLPGSGTILAADLHEGKFDLAGAVDPRVVTWALGVRQPVGAFSLSAQYLDTRFTNFTQGKDTGVMLGVEYALSKRTTLYSRLGYVQDKRGNVVRGDVSPVGIAGGPGALLVSMGSQEIPLFSGAGQNIDARTTLAAIGVRHSF